MARPRENILVRGVNWLGDAVMTTPALQRLREAKPEARIGLLTPAKLADLWQHHPSIDQILPFGANDGLFTVARRLRREKFDTALVLPNSPRSALEGFLARIPQRIGYARGFRNVLLTKAIPLRNGSATMHKRSTAEVTRRVAENCVRDTFPASAHHIHDYLHLAGELGANPSPVPPLLHVSEEEVCAARGRFRFSNSSLTLALNPGAEYGPAKRWPGEYFIEAAAEVHRATGCNWIVIGGTLDKQLAGEVTMELTNRIGAGRIVNVAGETSLRELCFILKASALLLTNDTGPMHVAAALGTPVIVPFGSTSPELTGPVLGNDAFHRILIGAAPCAPCFRRECPIDFRCMKNISVEQVVRAAMETLRGIARVH